ncbi:MAG: efflux RND transporter periplasmic adaptor subunit [Desulfatiglandaceae bacterium]
MKRGKWFFIIFVVCLGMGAYFYYAVREKPRHPVIQDADPVVPVAVVKVAPIKKETIGEVITAYGTVLPAPGAVRSISVPFESLVRHILVSEGQEVSRGTDLVEIEASADARLKMQEAQSAYEAAGQNLGKIRERVKLKMGTIEELLIARQTYQKAKIQLQDLEKRGIGEKRRIRSAGSGIVYRVNVGQGSVVPAGTAFLDIVPEDRIEVRLGVEQHDVSRLRIGQVVRVSKVNASVPDTVSGQIERISREVDPATRLVNIFATVKSPRNLLMGEYLRGRIVAVSKEALVVPRSAVLPEDGHYVLYTVSLDRARKHIVKTGLENNQRIEIINKDLKSGEQVVVLGNYELQDGMSIRMEAPR